MKTKTEFDLKVLPQNKNPYFDLLEEYWALEDNNFIHKPSLICEKYKLNQSELKKIISTYSNCRVKYGFCNSCKTSLVTTIHSQAKFKEYINSSFKTKCSECITKEREEENKKLKQHIAKQHEIAQTKFIKAIDEETWFDLNDEELDVLLKIVSYKTKPLIYANVLNYDPFNRKIWNIINHLVDKGLIYLIRDFNNSVLEYVFPNILVEIVNKRKKVIASKETFSLKLNKNPKYPGGKQPLYIGDFIFPEKVVLKANQKYAYAIWENTDGSIIFKLIPKQN